MSSSQVQETLFSSDTSAEIWVCIAIVDVYTFKASAESCDCGRSPLYITHVFVTSIVSVHTLVSVSGRTYVGFTAANICVEKYYAAEGVQRRSW